MSSSADPVDPWLRRVQALLTKAESTTFPAESEALIAKAQALMTNHAIDEAMLAAAGARARPSVVSEPVVVAAPYASANVALLGAVAAANRCRCVQVESVSGSVRCVLVGIEDDARTTTTLFAALSLHATRAMLAATVAPHDSPRRFRHAFLLAFAHRIGQRLREAADAARATAGAGGSGSVALVLADRDHEVERAFAAQFPHTRRTRKHASSVAGMQEGRAAAERAPLGAGAVAGRPSIAS